MLGDISVDTEQLLRGSGLDSSTGAHTKGEPGDEQLWGLERKVGAGGMVAVMGGRGSGGKWCGWWRRADGWVGGWRDAGGGVMGRCVCGERGRGGGGGKR